MGGSRVRDYSVLVDASSSMRLKDDQGKTRWEQAKEALEVLVPKVIEKDEDGISLYFFSTGYKKFKLVNSASVVKDHFASERPRGGTQLTEALEDAVIPDNKGRPETILVITDGAPENRRSVEDAIVGAAMATTYDDDLKVVFVQVGNDAGARKWLAALDATLQCPAGVVHATTSEDLEGSGLTLAQWVAKVVPV
jgi:Mg-chelatase subunit ChlD